MKYLIKGLRIILKIGCLSLIGCSHDDGAHPQSVPVDFFLTLNQKALFNYFTPNTVIRFFDSTSTNFLLLNEDSELDETTKDFHYGSSIGEYLYLYYSEAISYNYRLKIETDLIATPNQGCYIEIQFGDSLYEGVDFAFNPNDTNNLDTVFNISSLNSIDPYNGFTGDFSYKLFKSITLSSHTFRNVYLLKKQPNDTLTNIDSCYYAMNKGIVAFKVIKGAFWIRGN